MPFPVLDVIAGYWAVTYMRGGLNSPVGVKYAAALLLADAGGIFINLAWYCDAVCMVGRYGL